jgi:predicted kinase
MLICLGGLPANGKTTIGLMLAELYGDRAVLIDPDLVKLEILGRPPTDAIQDSDLTTGVVQTSIVLMKEKTRRLLEQGKIVIVPSAFMWDSMRQEFEALAQEIAVPMHAFWFEAPLATLHERAIDRQEKRRAGVRDATTISNVGPDKIKPDGVVGVVTWPVVRSDRPREDVLQDVLDRLPAL